MPLPSILRQPGRTGVVERGHARPRSALAALDGDVAQLVEHRLCKAGVREFKSPRLHVSDTARRWVLEVVLAFLGIRRSAGHPVDAQTPSAFPRTGSTLCLRLVGHPRDPAHGLVGVPAFGLLRMHVAGNRLADRLTRLRDQGVMAWIIVQVFFIPFFFCSR